MPRVDGNQLELEPKRFVEHHGSCGRTQLTEVNVRRESANSACDDNAGLGRAKGRAHATAFRFKYRDEKTFAFFDRGRGAHSV